MRQTRYIFALDDASVNEVIAWQEFQDERANDDCEFLEIETDDEYKEKSNQLLADGWRIMSSGTGQFRRIAHFVKDEI